MTQYGKIKSYDTSTNSGTIAPEKGGDALRFGKSDLQQEAELPRSGQRFSYETKKVAGNNDCAVNLRQQEQEDVQQDNQRSQAEKQQG